MGQGEKRIRFPVLILAHRPAGFKSILAKAGLLTYSIFRPAFPERYSSSDCRPCVDRHRAEMPACAAGGNHSNGDCRRFSLHSHLSRRHVRRVLTSAGAVDHRLRHKDNNKIRYYNSSMPAAAQRRRCSSGHSDACTSPMWAF